MNIIHDKLRKSLTLLIGLAAGAATCLPAAEQDNWYLAKEWSVPGSQGVAYRVDPATGKGRIYVVNTSTDRLQVYETDGTLVREVTGFYNPYDVAVDANGTTYVAGENSVKAHNADGAELWSKGGLFWLRRRAVQPRLRHRPQSDDGRSLRRG